MVPIRILVIGGTRFVGYQLVWRLVAAGHTVSILNRGLTPDPFRSRVERIVADRRSPAFAAALHGRTFDAAVDFAAFDAQDSAQAAAVLLGQVGHYVLISSGQVYLVLEGADRPGMVPESGYTGRVAAAPADPRDQAEWRYGVAKREAEDVLVSAFEEDRFPATRLRLPMVNGERDPHRRIEGYLWRILDGGPLLLPDGGRQPVRHVYAASVAQAILDLLGKKETFGKAFNLAQDEMPTLREFVEMLQQLIGATGEIVDVSGAHMVAAGLRPVFASAFSDPWMSCLDPAKAKAQFGFRHEPLAAYLGKITASFLSRLPEPPPESYAQRPGELTLVR
ncbi:MAG: NAD-dependent epimerase/dehydratase family protein [Thermaerobacter sp.]|nr:NAD-dependent epimerase/dehydratase family protein [Thermaerobacter sp.]